jgi:hypothetical protein
VNVEDGGDGEAAIAGRCRDFLEMENIGRKDKLPDSLPKLTVLEVLVRPP